MNKQKIFEILLEKVETAITVVETAIEESQTAANEHKGSMESQYDSAKEEAQAMVMAQSKRKASLIESTLILQKILQNNTLFEHEHSKVNIASVFTLDDDEKALTYIISPVLGGEEVEMNGQTIAVLSPTSPLGMQAMGKELDDDVSLSVGGEYRQFYVSSIL